VKGVAMLEEGRAADAVKNVEREELVKKLLEVPASIRHVL